MTNRTVVIAIDADETKQTKDALRTEPFCKLILDTETVARDYNAVSGRSSGPTSARACARAVVLSATRTQSVCARLPIARVCANLEAVR